MAASGKPNARPTSDPLWYKDAIIYEVRVRAFYDSDGDGIGDFRGLAQRLDYLHDLGVTALWLLPFYPSPLRDDGYDISDYTGTHPDCGTIEDFKHLLREAHRRGLRLITELVINHTSDQHPWFQRARRAPPGSRWRNFYVWSDTPERYGEARVIFGDFEPSNWTWDPIAKAYYWHRFYAHQPDLNFDSPEVRRAVFKVLDFWLGLGVDGLRLDAIPYLYERDGTTCENLPETHAFLKELRRHVDEKFGERMLLAEANQWSEDAVAYFGRGDECHMSFHFPIMPRLFMALHMEDRFPIIDILTQTPAIPENCQWAVFLRNHDELTLEMVTDEERDYMYRVYAFDQHARINLGIRRRLAPLLGNDRRRIELMTALLLSLPGTPVIYYGDEIGMGDNFFLGDRNGVRTPMQWSSDRNAGFSRANPQRLYLPVIIDPEYHYESINVEAQQNNLHSLLWWTKRLIGLRKRYQAFGRGTITFLSPSNRKVLAFIRRHENQRILVVANLSRFVQYAELDLSACKGKIVVELFGGNPFPPISDHPYFLTLGPHSFYWFWIEEASGPAAAAVHVEAPLPHLRAAGTWEAVFRGDDKTDLEGALTTALPRRRWFGGKAQRIKRVAVADVITVGDGTAPGHVVLARVDYAEGTVETYAVPLLFATGQPAARIRHEAPQAVLAELSVTAKSGVVDGVLYDAMEDRAFAAALLDAIGRRRQLKGAVGELVATHTRAFRELRGAADATLAPTLLRGEQSNSSVAYGDRVILKLYRRLAEGINPELDVGRFLTERTTFSNGARLAGAIEYRMPRREPITIGVLQGFVANEGDAWRYTLDELQRYFARVQAEQAPADGLPGLGRPLLDLVEEEPPSFVVEMLGAHLESARLLGQRTAQLHLALASVPEDPGFAPEPFSFLNQRALYQSMRNLCNQVFRTLRERLDLVPAKTAAAARDLLDLQDELLDAFHTVLVGKVNGMRIRCHGDYHLGQVLYTGKDFVIIDFEGEPARPLSERRRKHSPLRDVAGMLRSFDYAADTVLLGRAGGGVIRPEDIPVLEPWARFWRLWVGSAFVRAYLHQGVEAALLPRPRAALATLLKALLLEKSVYELGYELNNRPEWVQIPIRGIRELLAGGG